MKSASFQVFSALILSLVVALCPRSGFGDDIGTNFFLKASKSVPRIGRRSMDFDNHFLKASKSVPRIGRRGAYGGINQIQDIKGYPIVRNYGPEAFYAEAGQPLWSDVEKTYEIIPRMQAGKLKDDFDGNDAYWLRSKKDLEAEEQRFQSDV